MYINLLNLIDVIKIKLKTWKLPFVLIICESQFFFSKS